MGNMGLSMASNLMKNGFEVKGYDISEKSLEKAAALVSTSFWFKLINLYFYRVLLQWPQSKKLPPMLILLSPRYLWLNTSRRFFTKKMVFLIAQMRALASSILLLSLLLLSKNLLLMPRRREWSFATPRWVAELWALPTVLWLLWWDLRALKTLKQLKSFCKVWEKTSSTVVLLEPDKSLKSPITWFSVFKCAQSLKDLLWERSLVLSQRFCLTFCKFQPQIAGLSEPQTQDQALLKEALPQIITKEVFKLD